MNHLWNKAGGEKGVVWCLILLALHIALHQRNEENEHTVSHSVPTVGTLWELSGPQPQGSSWENPETGQVPSRGQDQEKGPRIK